MATNKNFVIKNGLIVNGSEVITSAGNLTNVGTINSAAITSSDYITVNNVGADKKISFNRTGGKNISIEHDANQIYFWNNTDSDFLMKMSNAGLVESKVGFRVNGTTVVDASRNLTSIGTISSTGLVKIDANNTINPLHIHDDSTTGHPGMFVTNTGSYATSTQSLYAKQYNSAVSATLFGQSVGGKGFIGTEGSASSGLLIGTLTADSVWIGTNNTAALTINSSQNATFAGLVDFDSGITVSVSGSDRLSITGGDVNVVGATDLQIAGSSRRLSFTSGTGTVRTTTANSLILETNSTTALTLNSSQNATFAGTISSGHHSISTTGTGNGLYVYGGDSSGQIKVGAYTRITGATANNTGAFSFNANYTGGQTNEWTPDYAGSTNAGMFVLRQDSGGVGSTSVYVKNSGTTSSAQALSTFTKVAQFHQDGYFSTPAGLRIGSTEVIDASRNLTNANSLAVGTASTTLDLDVRKSSTGSVVSRVWNENGAGTGSAIFRIANSGNNADGSQLQFTDNNYYVGTITADRTNGMRFRVANSSDPIDSSTIRLTINPSGNATFAGTINSGAIISSGTLSLGSYFQAGTSVSAGFYQDSANGAYRAIGTSSDRGFYFQSNAGANTYMYVGLTGTYAGRVGINNSAPSEALHVTGNIYTTGNVDAGGRVKVTNWIELESSGASLSSEEAGLRWDYNDSAVWYLYKDNANDGALHIQSAATGGESDNTPRVRFHRTARETYFGGAIGVNQYSVGSGLNLDVAGAIGISGTAVIDSSRNLTNIGTINSGAITSSGNINTTSNIGITQTDGDYLAKLYQAGADGKLELYTGEATPVSRIKLDSYYDSYINNAGGGLAIGKTTVGSGIKLDVVGAIGISGTTVIDSSRNLTNIGTISSTDLVRANSRISTSHKYPTGHYSKGDQVFAIDPTWSQSELQSFFNSTSVTWSAQSDAPGGYAVYINGQINVGGVYGSGFGYIPIETGDLFYMECWIKNVGENGHYMGSNEFNENFGSVGGNPGSFGYWVMANNNPGTSWVKVSGYISNVSGTGTTTGQFDIGAKYWTPQALFNYTNSSGTRACYISGWKVHRVNRGPQWIIQSNTQDQTNLTTNASYSGSVGSNFYPLSLIDNNTKPGHPLVIKNSRSDFWSVGLDTHSYGIYTKAHSANTRSILQGTNTAGNIVFDAGFDGDLTISGNLQISGTTVINSSRNLTNIGTGNFSGGVDINSGSNYPLQVSSTQRYQLQIRNPNNTTNSGYGWWLAHDTNFNFALHADGAADRFTLTRAGDATFTGNVTAYSDERLKENIQTLDSKKALQMRGVSFVKDGVEGSGVIAQEIEKIAPELVLTANDEMGTKSVAYGNLVGYLIEAIKEQQKDIEKLKEEVSSLRSKI